MSPVPTGDGDDEHCRDHDEIVFQDMSIPAESSNSETEADDFVDGSGYQLLPVTDPQESDNDEEILSQEDESAFMENMLEAGERWHYSNLSTEKSELRQLTQDRVEEIRFIMARVTLPPSNIPIWANIIPEEEWKEKLVSIARHTVSSERQDNCNADIPQTAVASE